MLFFPSQGQVCHSYCTFCFRWAQFIGDNDPKIATKEAGQLKRYVQAHPEITRWGQKVSALEPMRMVRICSSSSSGSMWARRFLVFPPGGHRNHHPGRPRRADAAA